MQIASRVKKRIAFAFPFFSTEMLAIVIPTFSDRATNLQSLNSANDGYNINLPYPAARSEIYFSSNRSSGGDNYDIICKAIDISYHAKDSILNFSIPANTIYSIFQTKLFSLIKTGYDELGPVSYSNDGWNYFFYANNESGNFDIKFVHTPSFDWAYYDGQKRLFGPSSATLVNSSSDDLYCAQVNDLLTKYLCLHL